MGKKQTSLKSGFGIIFKYIGVYRRELIALGVLGVLEAAVIGASPYFLGKFFDAILGAQATFTFAGLALPSWAWFLGAWAVLRLLLNLKVFLSTYLQWEVGDATYADHSLHVLKTLLSLPLSFHKEKKIGEVTRRFSQATEAIAGLFYDVIAELPPQFLGVIFGLGFAFLVNWRLAAVLLIGAAIYAASLIVVLAPIAMIHKKAQAAFARAFGFAFDALSNVQAVKQSALEEYEAANYLRRLRLAIGQARQRRSIWARARISRDTAVLLTQLAVFALSVFYVKQGTLTIGGLVMFNGYANMFFSPLQQLSNSWQRIRMGLATIESAEEILGTPPEIYSPPNAVILSDLKGSVEFKDVNFVYKKKDNLVLDGANFKINSGEKVALVGGSGEGKSTIADLVSGFWFAQKGKVLIDGHNVKNLDLKFLRGQIAVVPQEVVLFNDTIKKNIAYGRFGASDKAIERAARQAHADEFIESFPKKYDQVVGERGVKLSVGQKQRVAIARAALRDPKILILDEPTSALDAKSEKYITESLRALMMGRTTIIIAHRLSTVREADKILVLKGGKIVEQGKHAELIGLPNGVYRELYELQVGLS